MRAIKQGILASWMLLAVVAAASGQERIGWLNDLNQARQIAAQQGKVVLVHFTAPNCGPCRSLETYVFPNPQVARAISNNCIPVMVNAQRRIDLVQGYRVNSWPTDVFITPDGRELYRSVSPQDAGRYISMVTGVTQKHLAGTPQRPIDQLAQAAHDSRDPYRGGHYDPRGQQYDPRGAAPQNPTQNNRGGGFQPQGNASNYGDRGYDPYANGRPSYDPRQSHYNPSQTMPPSNNNVPLANRGGGYVDPQRQTDPNRQVAPTRPPNADPVGRNGGFQDGPNYGGQNPGTNYGQNGGIAQRDPRQFDNQPHGNQFADQQRPQTRQNEFYDRSQNNLPGGRPGDVPGGVNSQPPQKPAPSSPQIAAGNPPLALDGFCAVSLNQQGKWIKADTRWGAIHRGRTYLFAGPAQQKDFLNNPDKFAPLLSGYDPVRYVEEGKVIQGKREHGVFLPNKRLGHNQIFLFADERALEAFKNNPGRYMGKVYEAMRRNTFGQMRR